jgi:hypothetical protein
LTEVYQPLERKESTGSIQKQETAPPEIVFEEEFEEEEEISGGYVPVASSIAISSQISVPEDGELVQEELYEEATVEEYPQPILPTIPDQESPSKFPKELSTIIEDRRDRLSPEITLEAIAQKSTLLQKQESKFIPTLPNAAFARKTADVSLHEVSEDSDSPLDDLSHDRYEKLERLAEERRQSYTSNESKVTETTGATKREITEDPKPRKKGKWLDMILN